MSNKVVIGLVLVVIALSLVFNAKVGSMYYKNYIDIAPNHPNSEYAHLFPGRDYTNHVGITDWDQFFADHFLFIVGGEEGDTYQLFTINRQGCSSFSGVGINDADSIDFSAYINSAVLIRDYTIDENNRVVIKALNYDAFVNDNFAEYQEACGFPFERLNERALLAE